MGLKRYRKWLLRWAFPTGAPIVRVAGAAGLVMSEGRAVGVAYETVTIEYFERRKLKRHARVWSLWALGVGAVISGHFSGWNLGLASGGWGGMLVAAIMIADHVSRPGVLHRRVAGPAAFRRGLFLRAHRDGALGRLHHRAVRECRICHHAGGRGVLHRRLSDDDFRHAAGLPAGLLDLLLRGLRRPEHRGR